MNLYESRIWTRISRPERQLLSGLFFYNFCIKILDFLFDMWYYISVNLRKFYSNMMLKNEDSHSKKAYLCTICEQNTLFHPFFISCCLYIVYFCFIYTIYRGCNSHPSRGLKQCFLFHGNGPPVATHTPHGD